MIREIVIYGEPVLRAKGKQIEQIDDDIRALAGGYARNDVRAQTELVSPRNKSDELCN